MIGWLVFFGVLAFFLLVLCIPVCVAVRYRTDSPAIAYLRWLFVKYDLTGAEKKPAADKKKKKKQPEAPPAKSEKKKPESAQTFADKLGVIVDLLASMKDHAAMVVRGFRIYKLELNMLVGGEDSAQTAISYGQVNAAVYSAYGLANRLLNMTQPKIDIRPSFTCEQSDIMFELRARMQPIVLLGFALRAGVDFLVRIVRRGAASKKNRRAERADRAECPPREERAAREDAAPRDIRADRAARDEQFARAWREDAASAQARDERAGCEQQRDTPES